MPRPPAPPAAVRIGRVVAEKALVQGLGQSIIVTLAHSI